MTKDKYLNRGTKIIQSYSIDKIVYHEFVKISEKLNQLNRSAIVESLMIQYINENSKNKKRRNKNNKN